MRGTLASKAFVRAPGAETFPKFLGPEVSKAFVRAPGVRKFQGSWGPPLRLEVKLGNPKEPHGSWRGHRRGFFRWSLVFVALAAGRGAIPLPFFALPPRGRGAWRRGRQPIVSCRTAWAMEGSRSRQLGNLGPTMPLWKDVARDGFACGSLGSVGFAPW